VGDRQRKRVVPGKKLLKKKKEERKGLDVHLIEERENIVLSDLGEGRKARGEVRKT